jgi:hypothetical protein
MNEAIKLAIEQGGYTFAGFSPQGTLEQAPNFDAEIILDPLFWQALGKALGWKCPRCHINAKGCEYCDGKFWLEKSMEYYYLHMTGGDIDKFWKQLLTSN